MNDPIQVSTDDLALRKQKHSERLGWGFLAFIAMVALAFLIPLSVWLTRLALGG